MDHEPERRALAQYLEKNNLKHTKQRDVVLSVFLDSKGHFTSEDLYHRVKEQFPSVGYTTVYRTLKLLCEAGLASERTFDDGVTRYETCHEHHDHLVCTRCGRIVEFDCQLIESTQLEIAEKYGFQLLRHRHELYGLCSDCRES